MIPPYKKEFIKDAIFLSHSGLADFIRCPRSYYLKHLYREPEFGFKLQIASPNLSLGIIIHNTIRWYLQSPTKPTKEDSVKKFRELWRKYHLQNGGFSSLEEEAEFGKRGLKMLDNFLQHTQILEPCAPFIDFPKFHLIQDIILLGNFDFVGECSDESLHIVDFKTGAHEEEDPLQLYIYAILAEANFQKEVSKISFWYLDKDDGPKDVVLDPLGQRLDWLIQKGLEIKQAIKDDRWVCIKAPEFCRDCRAYQALLDGKGKYLYMDTEFKKMVYFLDRDYALESSILAKVL